MDQNERNELKELLGVPQLPWKVQYAENEGPCILPYAECVYRRKGEERTCSSWRDGPYNGDASCFKLGERRIRRHFRKAWELDGFVDPRIEQLIRDDEAYLLYIINR